MCLTLTVLTVEVVERLGAFALIDRVLRNCDAKNCDFAFSLLSFLKVFTQAVKKVY